MSRVADARRTPMLARDVTPSATLDTELDRGQATERRLAAQGQGGAADSHLGADDAAPLDGVRDTQALFYR